MVGRRDLGGAVCPLRSRSWIDARIARDRLGLADALLHPAVLRLSHLYWRPAKPRHRIDRLPIEPDLGDCADVARVEKIPRNVLTDAALGCLVVLCHQTSPELISVLILGIYSRRLLISKTRTSFGCELAMSQFLYFTSS